MDSILTINGGSSSLRFAVFGAGPPLKRVLAGKFERIGLPEARLATTDFAATNKAERRVDAPNHQACVPILFELLEKSLSGNRLKAIGHRVVHGGPRYRDPQPVNQGMLKELERISPFDPEHLPAEIALMQALQISYPGVPQIACFDTAFHRNLPRVSHLLPIPRRYDAQGVHRYGFHGLSFAYLLEELERVAGPESARGRIILAHLGNGASMAAVCGGESIDTTMGFTPTAGLVMSTRSGDLDPGLMAYFARTEGMTAEQFHHMVNAQSGLLGISETSSDVRDLLQLESTDVRAGEAIAVFCYQARKWLGALAAALGGLDTLVFAGGIGENSPTIRERICRDMQFMGIELDPLRNASNAPVLTKDASKATVRMIRTDEEIYIAKTVEQILAAS